MNLDFFNSKLFSELVLSLAFFKMTMVGLYLSYKTYSTKQVYWKLFALLSFVGSIIFIAHSLNFYHLILGRDYSIVFNQFILPVLSAVSSIVLIVLTPRIIESVELKRKIEVQQNQLNLFNQQVIEKENHLRGLTQKIFKIQEEECKKIADLLHEKVNQVMSSLRLHFEVLKMKGLKSGVFDRDEEAKIQQLIEEFFKISKSLIQDLRPEVLRSNDLIVVLDSMKNYAEKFFNIKVNLTVKVATVKICEEDLLVFFRVIKECIHNYVKHNSFSQLKGSTFEIGLSFNGYIYRLWMFGSIISEDKRGEFEINEKTSNDSIGLGKLMMMERLGVYNILGVEITQNDSFERIQEITFAEFNDNKENNKVQIIGDGLYFDFIVRDDRLASSQTSQLENFDEHRESYH